MERGGLPSGDSDIRAWAGHRWSCGLSKEPPPCSVHPKRWIPACQHQKPEP